MKRLTITLNDDGMLSVDAEGMSRLEVIGACEFVKASKTMPTIEENIKRLVNNDEFATFVSSLPDAKDKS